MRDQERVKTYQREEVETLFMAFKIAETTHVYNAVVNSCKNAGFKMVEGPTADLFNVQWTGYVGPNDIKDLNKY